MPKSSCLKLTYGRPGIDYRVAFHKVPNCYRKNPWKFEVNRSILTCRNERKGPNCLVRTDHNCRKTSFLKITSSKRCNQWKIIIIIPPNSKTNALIITPCSKATQQLSNIGLLVWFLIFLGNAMYGVILVYQINKNENIHK